MVLQTSFLRMLSLTSTQVMFRSWTPAPHSVKHFKKQRKINLHSSINLSLNTSHLVANKAKILGTYRRPAWVLPFAAMFDTFSNCRRFGEIFTQFTIDDHFFGIDTTDIPHLFAFPAFHRTLKQNTDAFAVEAMEVFAWVKKPVIYILVIFTISGHIFSCHR